MKVGGSCPCFTTMMGVSGSRPLGWVLRYSCTVVAAAFFSSSLACFPIQKKTCENPNSVSLPCPPGHRLCLGSPRFSCPTEEPDLEQAHLALDFASGQ